MATGPPRLDSTVRCKSCHPETEHDPQDHIERPGHDHRIAEDPEQCRNRPTGIEKREPEGLAKPGADVAIDHGEPGGEEDDPEGEQEYGG